MTCMFAHQTRSDVRQRTDLPSTSLKPQLIPGRPVSRGGNISEARQTSKEQTKMPRFMLEGPRPCTIFCFALIRYVRLRIQHVSIG